MTKIKCDKTLCQFCGKPRIFDYGICAKEEIHIGLRDTDCLDYEEFKK